MPWTAGDNDAILKVAIEEVVKQLKTMAGGKAKDDAGLVAEMLKGAGLGLLELIAEVFSDVMQLNAQEPSYWKESRFIVLHKKGDAQLPDNYRPISLLPILYKLFSRVLHERLKECLKKSSSVGQAGFMAALSCDDHLFTTMMLVEGSDEWQTPLWIALVDFRKAFDSIEHDSLWAALSDQGCPAVYVRLLENLYKDQSAKIVADKISSSFKLKRGTKQVDPISSTLFNSSLEQVMRPLKEKWAKRTAGVVVNGESKERLTNLRFADDLMLIGNTLGQVQQMLGELSEEAKKVGMQMHMGKTKILGNATGWAQYGGPCSVQVSGENVDALGPEMRSMYLGRQLTFGNFHDEEIKHRISCGWGKFAKYKKELTDPGYPLRQRLKLFNAVVTPTVLYSSGTWTMTKSREKRLLVAQRRMLRRIVKVGRRVEAKDGSVCDSNTSSSTPSEDNYASAQSEGDDGEEKQSEESWVHWIIRATRSGEKELAKARVPDWNEEQRKRKWKWAGHVARREDSRWSTTMIQWNPKGGRRRVGAQHRRWADDVDSYVAAKTEW